MPSTPTRSPIQKRFSLASSTSQSRPNVHFDDEALLSRPQTIDSALKKRLSGRAFHPLYSSTPKSPRDDQKSPRRRPPSIVLPSNFSLTASCPPTSEVKKSPRKRKTSIVLPVLPVYQTSPLKPRSFTIPLYDSPHDPSTPIPPHNKRRFSIEDNQPDPSFTPQTRILYLIPSATHQPPPQLSDQINQQIRSTFHYPDFDFTQHVLHRSYAVRTQYFTKDSECVTMLDTGVDGLLQRTLDNLPLQPDTTSMNINIKPSPGKGLGMFSRRHISTGESFLIEYPTVITPYLIGLSVGLSRVYADIFTKLSPPVFTEVMDLSRSSLISGDTNNDIHEAIMRTNALAIALPVPGGEFSELNTHRAIFLQTSRCNHSCEPNAKWDWDLKRFALVLTAVRPIKEGDEITIPYITLNMTSKERQDILLKFNGFKCLCSICIPPEDDNNSLQQKSDLARSSSLNSTWNPTTPESKPDSPFSPSSTNDLLPSFEKWCQDPRFSDLILIHAHLRALHFKENLNHDNNNNNSIALPTGGANKRNDDQADQEIGKHLDALAMCFGALEDMENFKKWMKRVSEVRMRKKPEHKIVFDKWLSNPETFPVWGWRRILCGDGDNNNSDSELSACVSMGMFDF